MTTPDKAAQRANLVDLRGLKLDARQDRLQTLAQDSLDIYCDPECDLKLFVVENAVYLSIDNWNLVRIFGAGSAHVDVHVTNSTARPPRQRPRKDEQA